MQVTQAAKGQSAFFRTNNGGYGTEWDSKQGGVDTADPTEVPKYAELVSLPQNQIASKLQESKSHY